jgi:hypothetical protein
MCNHDNQYYWGLKRTKKYDYDAKFKGVLFTARKVESCDTIKQYNTELSSET